jgi:hypothetical protein
MLATGSIGLIGSQAVMRCDGRDWEIPCVGDGMGAGFFGQVQEKGHRWQKRR